MTLLSDFKVLKKLSVSGITVEPRRVRARYTIQRKDGSTESTELIYSYERILFDPFSADDINLASMMLAQVALNYGLFFDEIEFDGLYDKADISFLKEMMENTSREIITNKLLVKNEFLTGAYRELVIEKKEKEYTAAKLNFINTLFKGIRLKKSDAKPDQSGYVILSSGGKDSLLSYGLIKEIGTPYPVFINEAGRHWFTAINSYRAYFETEPNTFKPWGNSDRVFNWMLKQLPFIRSDYATVRADIYPVRLWTVAVFIFGALPVAIKNNAGNIIIGNEYDTTVTGTKEGIKHYNGLYDQSRYFDNALTRYYHRKGWSINQFSMLRSLSELLIMKVLVKRYPHLQVHQVSCHAAHEVNGRMYPCGKCEKCRRIIGMLTALGGDPSGCGYSESQVKNGLEALERLPVKQLGSDAAHLFFLLTEGGFISLNSFTPGKARSHPEILKLRFDEERSNLSDIPCYVRKPLFDILTRYADGAVTMKNKKWHPVDPDEAFLLEKAYKFE